MIYIFASNNTTGAMGGRAGADSLCSSAYNNSSELTQLGCANIKAFISISATDYIADYITLFSVPDTCEIRNSTGVPIAGSWADLLDGNILTSISSAGITVSTGYWTGSNADGTYNTGSMNCANFTSTSYSGIIGNSASTSNTWLSDGTTLGSNSAPVLCICW